MDSLELIRAAHEGDRNARDVLVIENSGLVWSVAKRFIGRNKFLSIGLEANDLYQIGVIGLIKAIDKFDFKFNVQFSTYAIPMILGEIRRFLRDDGMIKVSRGIKELCKNAYLISEKYEEENGNPPNLEYISKELNIELEELVWAMESQMEVESLYKTIYRGENEDIRLIDKLQVEKNSNDDVINKIVLSEALNLLEPRDKEIIKMRYYMEKSQAEIACSLGISQVQVSRIEKKSLTNLRKIIDQKE